MKHFLIFLIALFYLMCVFSCQKSTQLKRDSRGNRSFSPQSEFDRDVSPTQKFESLGQPKKKILVLNFWNDTPVKNEDLGSFAAEELKRGLTLTQRVILPEDLKASLNTEDYLQGESVRVAQLMREGRRIGVPAIVIGRISKVVYRQKGDEVGLLRQKQSLSGVEVEAKLFDVQGGREVLATVRYGEASNKAFVAIEGEKLETPEYRAELIRSATRQAVANLIPDLVRGVEKLTWQGRIARIKGNQIYVNAGRASGLITGDILRVLGPGDDIYDPVSGVFLGRSAGQLKGTLEIQDFLGSDSAITIIHTGGNFKLNDLVQLY